MRRALTAALMAVAFSVCAPAAFAQETISYASISGRVADESGGVIRGADVSARQTETNVATSTVTDDEGRFRFPYLRVGAYEVSVRKAGFKTVKRAIVLSVGSAFDVPIVLPAGQVDETIVVSAETAVLEAARSQIAGTISQNEVKSLPLNGRNFLDLALLIPGVSPTNVGGSTQLFPETSAVPGVTLSIGSQRNLSNNFIVDGLSANDDAAALSGITYGVDAIDQFQVVTSGGQAELGRALGGYINIVTRSGTNDWRADAYDYYRSDRLNAKNALLGRTLPMSQAQFGGDLGGPIARDRTFVFSNIEVRRSTQSGLVTILPENVAAINARLLAVGYLGPLVQTGVYDSPVDTTNVLAKMDHELSARQRLSVRYSMYGATSGNSRGAGALVGTTASAGLDSIDQTVAVSHIATLGARTVVETRGQLTRSDLKAPPSDAIGPAVTITGVATFGTLSSSPTRRQNTLYQIVSNLSHQAGAHAVRLGVDALYNDLTITFPRAVRGSYAFSSLPAFLAGTYNNSPGFTQTFGTSVVAQTNPNLGVYVQDEWKAGRALTLNAGLRYDLQWMQTIRTDTNNVSPRVGFVWSPSKSQRTLLRGSAGMFYDRVPLRAVANALLSAGNTTDLANLRQISVSLAPAQAGAPVFPNILDAFVPTTTLVNLTTMDRAMQSAHSQQASLELEQQLGARYTVSVGYEQLFGRQLIVSINQNVPTCAPAGTNNGCRPIATYANNSQYTGAGRSNYHAMHVSLVQRPARWGSYRVSYTYSKSMNNVGEAFFNGPIDPTDINKDWGRSDDDQRHRLVVSGATNTPTTPATNMLQRLTHGFQFSGMLQYYSALPFNITSGVSTIQGTAGRPIVDGVFIERNAGEGSDFFAINLRVSRTFSFGPRVHLEALVEAFNLLNRRNDLARNGNFGAGIYPTNPSSAFGTITAVGDPRSVQLGLRLKF